MGNDETRSGEEAAAGEEGVTHTRREWEMRIRSDVRWCNDMILYAPPTARAAPGPHRQEAKRGRACTFMGDRDINEDFVRQTMFRFQFQ